MRNRDGTKIQLGAISLAAIVAFVMVPSASAAAATECGGAALPSGYAIDDGRPHQLKVNYGDPTLYNPQSISLFLELALLDTRNSSVQQTCLATFAGNALMAGSAEVTLADGSGTALKFPYPFAFSANPSTPTLQPGWISGLAQSSAMEALAELYDRTQDAAWLTDATKAFNSFRLQPSEGGFVTHEGGRTYFQEYPTTPPSYVLNGMNETVVELDRWFARTADPLASQLRDEGASSVAALLPLHDAPITMGVASTYDLLRGYKAAPLRITSSGAFSVRAAAILDGSGHQLSRLSLPVGSPPVRRPNLLANSTMSSWSSGWPVSWSVHRLSAPGSVSRVASGGQTWLRLTTSGKESDEVGQDVPVSKIAPNSWYRVSWRARDTVPTGKQGASGSVVVTALCPDGAHELGGNWAVRGPQWSWFDLAFKTPNARCAVRVVLSENEYYNPGTSIDVDDVTLSISDYATPSVVPVYPLSVIAEPTLEIGINYTGSGALQAWLEGRWKTLATLPSATARFTTVSVPVWAQGRDIHLGYHENHVFEMWTLYKHKALTPFRTYFYRWVPLSPKHHDLLSTPI